MIPILYRINFSDGETSPAHRDYRDALRDMWGRAAIVQYRSFLEQSTDGSQTWTVTTRDAARKAKYDEGIITEVRG